MIRNLTLLLLVLLAGVHAACNRAAAATLSGTVMMTYSNKPYVGAVLIRPLSTPLTINGNLVTGGDFKAITDANGNLTVALQAGNYRVTIGADKGFTIDVPNDNNTYTWISRIITSLTWNSSIIPSTNSTTATLISYTNVAEMLAATPPTTAANRVAVLGRSTPNDGGGGDFWFDSASSAATNLGTIFAPNSGSGRWRRIFPGSTVYSRWFGAKADGITDDTIALQSFLDWRDPSSGKAGTYVFQAGHYRWNSITATAGKLIGDGQIHRGNNVVAETTVVCEQILGATDDFIVTGGNTANKSVTIDNLLLLGHPEYNIRDPYTITQVFAGDRLHFAISSPPVIEGGKGGPPYLGFGAVFDDSNHFLGSFCLQSFITNGVVGSTATNIVNIMPGTDGYATVAGENILRVGFKVCFPKSTEWFIGATSMGQRSFSSRAGYSAIRVWNSDQSNLRNIKCVNWHTGIVIASIGYTAENIETYNCHLSGMIAEPFGFLADNTSWGFLLFNGKYQPDDALAASPYTLKNTLYRSSAIGFGALGAQAKHGQIVAGPSAIYGAFIYGGVNSHIDNLLIESPTLTPVYIPQGNSATPQTATTINRLRILGGYSSDTTPDNRPSTIPIVDIGSSGAGLSVAQLTVGRFTESGNGTNWSWGYLYNWPAYATNTGLLAIGNLVDPNRMVAAHNPGGTSQQQAWNLLGGTTVTGGSATQPIMTWERDVAEPNANKVGLTYSAGAKLLFAHDGDGIVNDVGITFESTSSATQITSGNNSGSSAPRNAIIQGEPATGTDTSGGNLFIRSGAGRGNASASSIFFQTPTVGSSGSTAQNQTTRLTLGQGGQLTFTGLTADPTVGTSTGSIYYNSASNSFRWHNGTSWANFGSGGGGSVSGPISPDSVTLLGTAGAGFVTFPSQSATPSAPASGFVEYADASGRVAWRRASDGFTRTFDSTLTANRTYTWPDTSGTIALTGALGAATGTSLTLNGSAGAGFVSFPSQSSVPAAPGSGFVEYADSLGRMAWRRASDGFVRTFASTLTADRTYTWPDANTIMPIVSQQLTISGPTAARTITVPDANFTAARTDAAQTFLGTQTFGGGAMYIGNSGGTSPYIFSFVGNSDGSPNATGLGMSVFNYASGNNEYGVSFRGSSITATAGDSRAIHMARTFAPTSGTATWSQLSVQPTINQTGGASGITRGLFVNSSVTAAADHRALEVAGAKSFYTYSPAAGESAIWLNGTWFLGGTATTTKPMLLVEPTGTTSTGWSTSGTGLGINAASGFAGNLVDVQVAGATRARISSAGDVTAGRYNGVTVTAGTGSPAVTVNGSATISGINTGDQQIGGAGGWRFYEEFNWNSSSAGGSGWLVTASGGANQIAASPSANRPGIFQFSTSTSATGNPNIMDNASSLFLGGGPLTMEWSARLTTALPDAVEDYDVWMGLGDVQTSSSQTDGVYFMFDRGVSASNWQFVTAKAGIRSTTDTGIAANGAGTWQKFRFEVNSTATQVIAFIDGVACATNTAYLPDTSANVCGKMFGMLKQAGTTARIMQLDYIFVSQDFTSAR